MALITCPECKQQVSELAVSCPTCGCPIAHKCREEIRRISPPPIPEMKDQSGRSEIVLPDQCSNEIELPPEPRTSPGDSLAVLHQELQQTRSSARVSGLIWLGLAIIVGGVPTLSMLVRSYSIEAGSMASSDARSMLFLPLFLLPLGAYFDLRASIGRRAYTSKIGFWLAIFAAAFRTNIILILLFVILGHLVTGGSGGGFSAGVGLGVVCVILMAMGQLVTAIGVFLRLRRIERAIGSATGVSEPRDKGVIVSVVVATLVILVAIGFPISLSNALNKSRERESDNERHPQGDYKDIGKSFAEALKEGDPERARGELRKAEAGFLESIEEGAKGVGESAGSDRAMKQVLDEVIPIKRDFEAKFRELTNDPNFLNIEWLSKGRNLALRSDSIANYLAAANSYHETREASSKKLDALMREEGVSRERREIIVDSFSNALKGARPLIIASIEWGEAASKITDHLVNHRDQWSYEGEEFLYETDEFHDELLRLNDAFALVAERVEEAAKRWVDSMAK